jgi:hypothetical protein
VREANPNLFALLEGVELRTNEPGRVCLAAPSAFNKKRLDARRAELEAACAEFFGAPTRVEIEEPERTDVQSASTQRELEKRRRHEALNHAGLNEAVQILSADIVEIRPLGTASDNIGNASNNIGNASNNAGNASNNAGGRPPQPGATK